MKTLPGWMIAALVLAIIGGVLTIVSRFAEKSLVFAQGEVSILPELEADAKNIRTLFIVLYDEASPMPMPFGAWRQQLDKSPKATFVTFTLTKDNIQMMNPQNLEFPKSLRIKARLDADGIAGVDQPGDLVGELTGVQTGSTGLRLAITNRISP